MGQRRELREAGKRTIEGPRLSASWFFADDLRPKVSAMGNQDELLAAARPARVERRRDRFTCSAGVVRFEGQFARREGAAMSGPTAGLAAWVRDETALQVALVEDVQADAHRAALEALGNIGFDARTAVRLREQAENLLETLSRVLSDDALWAALEAEARTPPSDMQLARIRSLTRPDLAALFEAAGYRNPPPPPVVQRVDDLQTALAQAATRPNDNGASIRAAKYELGVTLFRARRQIVSPEAGAVDTEARIRSAVRGLLHGVRYVGPVLIGTSVAMGTGSLELGWASQAAVRLSEQLLEDGLRLGADTLRGWIVRDELGDGGQAEQEGPTLDSLEVDPVRVHAVALVGLLHGSKESGVDTPQFQRHARRLAQLLADEDVPGANELLRLPGNAYPAERATELVHLANCLLQERNE